MENRESPAFAENKAMNRVLELLAEKLSITATVTTVFGEPLEAYGKTLIPVARVGYGLGGGYGMEKIQDQERRINRPAGVSGGGGITVRPLGVYEINSQRTRFIPLHHRRNSLVAALAAAAAVTVLAAGVGRRTP